MASGNVHAWRYWPEQGLWNPCRGPLPPHLARHELVAAAWDGLDPRNVWDCHAHLIGAGDSDAGVFISPHSRSLLHPGLYARRLFFLNAGCVDPDAAGGDRAYVERMRALLDGMDTGGRRGVKLVLFAFERAYDESGEPDLPHTTFHIPDAYARDTAKAHPQYFEWAASIHPYARDALERLARAKRDGARGVKWLPSAMGIDPASPRCQAFFEALQKHDLPLISHAGEEHAVVGRGQHDYSNPLRLRRALDAGVRVVVAHCASRGADRDLDQGAEGPLRDSFELFSRLFEERRYEKHLFADISAMTQVNRAGPVLTRVIENQHWHARLLNGSDYPLPGVMPLFSTDYLASLGLLQESEAATLREIRAHNALLFDFVLKRALRSKGKALPARVFETRMFFMR